jgi:hypothetical protein
MDTFYKVAALGLPVVLALLAVFVTLWPPKQAKRVWVVVFVVVGALSFGASFQQSESENARLTEIMGGDSFCYLHAEQADRSSPSSLVVWVANRSDYTAHRCLLTISPASAPSAGMPGYASFGGCAFADVPPRNPAAFVCRELPTGRYHIDSTAANGTVSEELELAIVDGELRNSILVKKDGHEIFSTPGLVTEAWFGKH